MSLFCLSTVSGEVTLQKDDFKHVDPAGTKTTRQPTSPLQRQIREIASAAKGRIGVKAVVLETGDSVSYNADGHFPMQSVYKLPIGLTVLRQVDAGKIKLDQTLQINKTDFVSKEQHSPIRDRNPDGAKLTVQEVLRFAVSESDGTASDVLLDLVGGPKAVSKCLNDFGVTNLVVANSEKEIGQDWETQYRNWSTPDAAVALLRALHERRGNLSKPSQALLLKIMRESPTGSKRLKGLLPAGTPVAHKTGTSGKNKGITAATNDIGLVALPNGRHLAIAVFVCDSPEDEKTREAVIAKLARVAWDEWSK